MTAARENSSKGRIVIRVDSDLEDLVPVFLKNRRTDILALREAMGKGDYETVRIFGHNMKGTGGGYGFDAITDIGRTLEQAAKDRNNSEISRQIAALEEYLDRIDIVFEAR